MPKKTVWTNEKVFDESHKYTCRSHFKQGAPAAFRIAYINGWLEEMTWLVRPQPKSLKWTKEAVFYEAHKYTTLADFAKHCKGAYNVARKHCWLKEFTWLARKHTDYGKWQIKENVFKESRKYHTTSTFAKGSPAAYESARKHNWLVEMTWLLSTRKPNGYWQIKANVMEESKRHKSRNEFYMGSPGAYNSALAHGWLDEMTWLDTGRAKKGFWQNKENVTNAARKCSSRSEFQRLFPTACNVARANKWLDEYDWLKPKQMVSGKMKNEPIHFVYAYLDEKNKVAYVGATKNIKERDAQHRKVRDNDAVYRYFTNNGQEIPKPIILQSGLLPIERQAEEMLWSLHYQDRGYTLLNKLYNTGVGIGSLGGGPRIWTEEKVLIVARRFRTIKDFMTKEAGAYDAALRYGMMNIETMPWFYENRKPSNWWSMKEHVFDESKKYHTLNGFEKGSPSAHFSARKHGWIGEMVWLEREQAPQGYWQNEENAIEAAKKYKTRTAFKRGCSAGYNYINDNNLWHKVPWLALNGMPRGYWQIKENVFAESRKYHSRQELKKGCPSAYSSSVKHKWLDEMTWLEPQGKPRNYWNVKENIMREGRLFNSRVAFRWGSATAYHSAVIHGWIDEMTWLKRPKNYNQKWTKEKVFEVARGFRRRGELKKVYHTAYQVARRNQWFDEMSWLK